MDNKPTIDGLMAPRELLERIAESGGYVPRRAELRALLTAGAASRAPAVNTDVRTILLDITPGADGMGHEVYARSCEDVVSALSKQGDRIEEMEMELHRLKAIKPQPAPAPSLIAQSVGVLTFMRDETSRRRCACCTGDHHVFSRYFKGLPTLNDLTENMRHRDDLEGREFRVTVELVGPLPPVRHS